MAQSDSAYGHIVSFGMNHPISTGSVNNELQIVKALLSELNSGATDATDLYIAYTNTPNTTTKITDNTIIGNIVIIFTRTLLCLYHLMPIWSLFQLTISLLPL